MKRFTALLLTLALAFGAFTVTAAAKGGTWGNLTWELGSDGTLTVTGAGRMDDRKHNSEDAWRLYSESVKSIVISDGITSVGDDTFYYFTALESVSLPDSVDYIGVSAFAGCEKLKSVNLPAGLFFLHAAAFSGCPLIESITVPEKVNYIGADVFYGCDSLALVYVKSPVVAAMLTSFTAGGGLLEHAKTVVFSDGITVTDYVKGEYPVTGAATFGGEKVNWYKKSGECAVHLYEDDVCAICGHVRGEDEPSEEPSADDPSTGGTPEDHVHSYTGWKSDDAKHWHECSVCGEKADEAEHGYDGDICSVCGHVRESTALLGDANGDGAVNNIDASLVLQYDAGVASLESTALAAADVNADSAVNNIDASRILQLDAGVIGGF